MFDFPISGIISTRSRCIFFLYLWFLFRRGRRRKRRITCSGHNYFYSSSVLFVVFSFCLSFSLSVSSLYLILSLSLFLSLSPLSLSFVYMRTLARKVYIYFSVEKGQFLWREFFSPQASSYVRIFKRRLLINPENLSGKFSRKQVPDHHENILPPSLSANKTAYYFYETSERTHEFSRPKICSPISLERFQSNIIRRRSRQRRVYLELWLKEVAFFQSPFEWNCLSA